MSQPVISKLFIYPLKSAKGIEVTEMPILSSGPQWDREWMLVKESGLFISQRTHPILSQYETALTHDNLVITSPGGENLEIPLARKDSEIIEVGIFGKTTTAEWLGSSYDQWWSDQLNEKVKLVRSPRDPSRFTSGNNGPVTEIQFADGYPLLLANESTLEKLNSQLSRPVPMNRFRPNIIISNSDADTEDSWKAFNITNVPFLSVKACTRCSIINVDQDTSQSDKEVTKVLKSYRTKDGNVIFGMNLSHQGLGTIKVGDVLSEIQ